MREIKFRAWDKEEKEFEIKTLLENGYCYDITFDKQMDIQQFTGLKDKNGKEIYEGDIVGWGKYNYCVYWDNENGEWATKDLANDKKGSLKKALEYNWEVIGNIYENPELLTNK
jgi:uncharacterized phage protein (TIGR01671 family)